MSDFNMKRKSFYISLCVCVLAIGAAGFSTYKSIKDFSSSEKKKNSYTSSVRKKKTPEEIPKKNNFSQISESKPIQNKSKNELVKAVNANVLFDSFVTPIEYVKVSKFDDNLEYSDRFKDWRNNDGVDLKGLPNCDVYSVSDGKIIEVFEDPSYGYTIRAVYKSKDNADIITSYYDLNNDNIKVKKGDLVKKGQKISSLKNDVLHLTMQKNNKMIDPCEVLGIES